MFLLFGSGPGDWTFSDSDGPVSLLSVRSAARHQGQGRPWEQAQRALQDLLCLLCWVFPENFVGLVTRPPSCITWLCLLSAMQMVFIGASGGPWASGWESWSVRAASQAARSACPSSALALHTQEEGLGARGVPISQCCPARAWWEHSWHWMHPCWGLLS